MMHIEWKRALVLAALLCACNDGLLLPEPDNPISEATVARFEGIYALTSRTENETGCDAEGPSILDTTRDPVFFIVGDEVFGQNTAILASCADEAECRDKIAAIRARDSFGAEYLANFGEEPAPGELVAFTSSTGFEEGGVCMRREGVFEVLTGDGDTVRLEERTTALEDKPVDSEGFCFTSPIADREEAEGRPCTELQVLIGQRMADL